MTVNRFAEVMGVEKNVAYGVLRFLAEAGIVVVEKVPQAEGKKGKPTNKYHIDADVGYRLGRYLGDRINSVPQPNNPLPGELLDGANKHAC